jgi:allantoate deiminase
MNARDAFKAAVDTLERCDHIASYTEEVGRITRTFLARQPMERVHSDLKIWMKAAGMQVRVDGLGNIVGRREGTVPGAPALLIGSHLDTVPDAGRYDGVLGVMLGLKVAELTRDARPPIAIEVVGFSEEEGVRFRTPYIGSKAFVGRLEPEAPDLCGADGRSVREAARAFGCSGEPGPFDPSAYLGYLEAHIEQGPVLESLGLPLGVVTGIAGQSRVSVTITGRAAHAGATPMHLRRDALVAAAQFVGEVNDVASLVPGLVATVGRMEVSPGASNVVPGIVHLSVDVRHEQDEVRRGVMTGLIERGRAIAAESACTFDFRVNGDYATVPMDAGMVETVAQACAAAGATPHRMTSGAGHDAAVLAGVMPACMLFLRSPGGIRHHPDAAVIREDVELAINVMREFVRRVAASYDATRAARP